jgi:probable F420-dependent oxidoreductase
VRLHLILPGCMHVAAISQPWEWDMTGADVIAVAQEADRLGFESVLIPEHYLTAAAHLELSGNHYFDASTAQGVIAGATQRITVGSLVTILPLHHPVVLAKSLATLDWLSGGRAAVTFGVGWQVEEFAALGVPFDQRGRMADEYLAAILELWHSDDPCFDGEFVSFKDVAFGPKPIRTPHPPIWLGGDAPAVVRRAARFADGWAPWLTPPAKLPKRIDQLCSSPDFDGRPFSIFYSLAARNVGIEHEVRHEHAGASEAAPQETIDQCAELASLGVTDTWVSPPPLPDQAAYLDHLRWVAERVLPAVRPL